MSKTGCYEQHLGRTYVGFGMIFIAKILIMTQDNGPCYRGTRAKSRSHLELTQDRTLDPALPSRGGTSIIE